MLIVPYKGSGPALIDLMGGQVHVMADPMPSAFPLVKAARSRRWRSRAPGASRSCRTRLRSRSPAYPASTWSRGMESGARWGSRPTSSKSSPRNRPGPFVLPWRASAWASRDSSLPETAHSVRRVHPRRDSSLCPYRQGGQYQGRIDRLRRRSTEDFRFPALAACLTESAGAFYSVSIFASLITLP